MKKTPLQTVNHRFGSREKLVEELVKTADRLKGDTSESETRSRLMGLSNSKLLRLAQVEQTVRERFGDRVKLIKHIVETRTAAGHTADADFEGKLETYSKARLLDMTRIRLGDRTPKQTPEEKLARKRGRKAKERALAAIKAKG
ncbi:MAG: hypothetical protein ACFB9M_19575 [Myxococcota bacterium]